MDPQATLRELCEAIENGEHDDARLHARNLAGWIRKGGFMPLIEPHVFEFLLANLADSYDSAFHA